MGDAAAIYAADIGATKLAEVRTPYPYLPESVWDFAPKGGEQAGEQSVSQQVLFALDEAALRRASQPA